MYDFFVAALGFHCCLWAFSSCGHQGCALVVVSGGYSLTGLHGLLIVVTSPVAEHQL